MSVCGVLREISKPLVPVGQAGVLLVQILKLLCKEMVCPSSIHPLDEARPCFEWKLSNPFHFITLNVFTAHQTPKKVGAMWREGGLNWTEFLPEDEDVNTFVSKQVSRLKEFKIRKHLKKQPRRLFLGREGEAFLNSFSPSGLVAA